MEQQIHANADLWPVRVIQIFLRVLCIAAITLLAVASVALMRLGQMQTSVKMLVFWASIAINAIEILRNDRQFALMLSGDRSAKVNVSRGWSGFALLLMFVAVLMPN